MIVLTEANLAELLRHRLGTAYRITTAQRTIIAGIVEHQEHLVPSGILDTRFRTMHFLAQAAHETDSFKTLQEYASGAAYEGRDDLGNTRPGDGRRYKGRGIFQLTGRSNYRQVGGRIGIDLENNPLQAMTPDVSVMTAGAYWTSRNINSKAGDDERHNVVSVTRLINGGLNGFDDRLKYFLAAGRVEFDVTDAGPEPTGLDAYTNLQLLAELVRRETERT